MVQLLQNSLMHMQCNSNGLAAITRINMFPGEAFGRVKGYFITLGTLPYTRQIPKQ